LQRGATLVTPTPKNANASLKVGVIATPIHTHLSEKIPQKDCITFSDFTI
jgi:hypothetical protein